MKSLQLDLLKKIKVSLVFAILTLSVTVNAQSKFGVKASVSHVFAKPTSVLHSSNGWTYTNQVYFLGQSGARSVGLFWKKNLDFLFIEADVSYASYTAQYKILDISEMGPQLIEPPTTGGPKESTGIRYTQAYKNLDIGLLAGIHVCNLEIGLGPIFHRTISLDSQLEQVDGIKDRRKLIDPGFLFKVGYNIGPINVALKYEDFFLKAGEHFTLDNKKLKFDSPLNSIKLEFAIGF